MLISRMSFVLSSAKISPLPLFAKEGSQFFAKYELNEKIDWCIIQKIPSLGEFHVKYKW